MSTPFLPATAMHQAYVLDIPVVKSALSVKSFELTESIGAPYKAVIRLTCPDHSLPLLKLLDQPASFSIAPAEANRSLPALAALKPTRQWHGVITGCARLSSSIDETVYEFTLEPRLARLKNHVDTVLHQNLDLPGVIEATLRSDAGLIGNDFVFQLTGTYPVKEHVTRYREDGLTFIRRLCEECGLFYFFRQTEDREIIVFGDDQTHYQKALNITLQRANAGLESTAQAEAIRSLNVHAQPVIGAFQRQDYNYRKSGGQSLLSESGAYPGQPGFVGKDYRFGEHQKTPEEGKLASKLRFEAAQAQQVIASGAGNVIAFAPGQVFRPDVIDANAEFGWIIVSVEHRASRQDAYTNEYTAIPADRIYRLPFNTKKPKIAGTIPARITSPSRYTNAYLDESGRYRISFNFDNNEWPPAGSSRPVRLAKPYSGDTYGLHFPLIDGTEVQVAFVDGDIDRPYIAHALHDQTKPDHVTNKNNTRNIIRTPSNNKIRLEDKDNQQHIKVSTEYGKSQLNLGHLVDAVREKRGEGFELRTDEKGAIRAAKGLFITADGQPKAGGKQLDMHEATNQLEQALQLAKTLADAAHIAQAELAALQNQKQQLEQSIKNLQQAALVLSAPSGIAATSPQSVQLSAGQHLTGTAGGNADYSVMKKFTVAAGEAVSLFAQRAGMKLFANKGKVQIQAQNDAMELASNKDMVLTSNAGQVRIAAKNELLLSCGGGYIKIGSDGGVELGSPLDVKIKAISLLKQGPSSTKVPLPTFPLTTGTHSQHFDVSSIIGTNPETGQIWAPLPYELRTPDGQVVASGKLDGSGNTSRIFADHGKNVELHLGDGDWRLFADAQHDDASDIEE